jgi:hypothetical protein
VIGVPADVFVDGTADPGVMDGVCVGLVAELVEDPDDDDADDGEPIEPVVARASRTTSVAVEPTMAARLTIRVTSRARLAGCRRVRLIGLALRSTLIRTSSSAVSTVERGPEGFLDEDCERPVSASSTCSSLRARLRRDRTLWLETLRVAARLHGRRAACAESYHVDIRYVGERSSAHRDVCRPGIDTMEQEPDR